MKMKNTIPDYTLRRSARRRTIEIQVRTDEIRVLAPSRVAQRHIDGFVVDKIEWIHARQQELLVRQSLLSKPKPLGEGSQIFWLGEALTLRVLAAQPQTSVQIMTDEIQLRLSRRIRKPINEAISEQLERWLRDQAHQYFQQRVSDWSEVMGVEPVSVIVRSYRRKWGCCNSRRVVSFNWLLIMAPVSIIDYVIVHELSHLREMNHSPRFWAEVEKFYPDYRQAKNWLNNKAERLQWPPVSD